MKKDKAIERLRARVISEAKLLEEDSNNINRVRYLSMLVWRYMHGGSISKPEPLVFLSENALKAGISRSDVISEHKVPVAVMRDRIQGKSSFQILRILFRDTFWCHVTKEEDRQLRDSGYQYKMPEVGTRYQACGIVIHPNKVSRELAFSKDC